MPKKAKPLTAVEVNRIRERGLHAVGSVAGLCLQVAKDGSRSWILRATVAGKRRSIGLGGFPDVTLAGARDKARELRAEIQEGIDPVERRRAARAAEAARMTFDQCAERLIAAKAHEWRNPKHRQQWENTLATYASPILGSMPVDAIELKHVQAVLAPIWQSKTETASRLRSRIEAVLAWATATGLREGDNPARWRGNLEHILAKPTKVAAKQRQPALPFARVHEFVTALRKREGMAAKALEFQILTATRPGEVRFAQWQEIDLQAGTWTIPADRMKAGREHVVPLSNAAIKLLKSLPRFTGQDLVFPAPRGSALSDGTLAKIIRDMHKAHTGAGGAGWTDERQKRIAVAHGFRSTFRDWSAECTAYQRDVCEMALAHTISSKAEAAYRRGDLLAKRARLMEDWARFVDQPTGASVTPIKSRTA